MLQHAGSPRALAWTPDGHYLVAGTQENALRGWRVADGAEIELAAYPGQPLSLSFSEGGHFLATSGGPRVVCWRFDSPEPGTSHTECGIPSSVPVTKVACHPSRAVVAAAYQNGAVLLCKPGVDDTLFVRAPSGTPITALAWSADGIALATGTEDGEIGVVTLPDRIFRASAEEPR
jgi:WD40 repeat protein